MSQLAPVSHSERSLIEAALAFANLRAIESNQQVEKLFSIPRIPRVPRIQGELIGDAPVEFVTIDAGSRYYMDRTQPMLRRWLQQTIAGTGGRAEAAREVALLMPRDIRAIPVFSMCKMRYDFQVTGVDAGCALALALILDEDRRLATRLQQCTASCCGRFNLDFDARARPRKYCSASHRTMAHYEQSPERMRQWRKAA